jgi:hypothetical protein
VSIRPPARPSARPSVRPRSRIYIRYSPSIRAAHARASSACVRAYRASACMHAHEDAYAHICTQCAASSTYAVRESASVVSHSVIGVRWATYADGSLWAPYIR